MSKLFTLIYMFNAFLRGFKLHTLKSIRGRVKKDNLVKIEVKGKARIYGLDVTGSGKLIIHNDVEIRNLYVQLGTGAEVIISKGTFIGKDVKIISYEEILIGEECLIAPNAVILDNEHVINDRNIKHSGLDIEKTIIEHNCWIGANSIVGKGVIMSTGTILGCMSYLKCSTEINSTYVGIPAKIVKNNHD